MNKNTMYNLGRITAQVFGDDEVPLALLDTLLVQPATGLALLTKRIEWKRAEGLDELMDLLPADLSDPDGGIKTEDQMPFWMGYYKHKTAIDRSRKYDEQDLTHVGKLLYGDKHWQAGLARDLNVDPRRIRQWISKERPIPATIWDDLAAMMLARKKMLDEAIAEFRACPGTPR